MDQKVKGNKQSAPFFSFIFLLLKSKYIHILQVKTGDINDVGFYLSIPPFQTQCDLPLILRDCSCCQSVRGVMYDTGRFLGTFTFILILIILNCVFSY